jgi:hypothetical protein
MNYWVVKLGMRKLQHANKLPDNAPTVHSLTAIVANRRQACYDPAGTLLQ